MGKYKNDISDIYVYNFSFQFSIGIKKQIHKKLYM
jgi:hypothetical protein